MRQTIDALWAALKSSASSSGGKNVTVVPDNSPYLSADYVNLILPHGYAIEDTPHPVYLPTPANATDNIVVEIVVDFSFPRLSDKDISEGVWVATLNGEKPIVCNSGTGGVVRLPMVSRYFAFYIASEGKWRINDAIEPGEWSSSPD